MRVERVLLTLIIAFVGASGCSQKYLGMSPDPGPSEPFDAGTPVNPALPTFMTSVNANDPPPPISGGTLLMTKDGTLAVAADADRDTISVVRLATHSVLNTISLRPHDEPGRLVEDGAGRIYVALRRGGALVTIDPVAGTILDRRSACALPRGLAYEKATDRVHVACAGGELVSFPAGTGAAVRTVRLERDLRDVVVDGDRLLVSRFRESDVLIVDAAGAVSGRIAPPGYKDQFTRFQTLFTPSTAWNMKASPKGGALLLHQRGDAGSVPFFQYYGDQTDPCRAAVHPALTPISTEMSTPATVPLAGLTLAVDFDVSRDGQMVAFIAAGNAHNTNQPSVFVADFVTVTEDDKHGCSPYATRTSVGTGLPTIVPASGEIVAVAFDVYGQVIVQSREPATLQFLRTGERVELSKSSRADLGHEIFHANAGAGLACASCHAEGQDDGRVWGLTGSPRRTMSLVGGIAARTPYHWSGDLPDFSALVSDTYVSRMQGQALSPAQTNAVFHWVDSIPRLPAIKSDAAAIDRGHALFADPTRAACANCHSGPAYTNSSVVDVGTGGLFKVPTLIGVAFGGPYLHDGCATTLDERFGSCGGAAHGATAKLSAAERADLIAYIESL